MQLQKESLKEFRLSGNQTLTSVQIQCICTRVDTHACGTMFICVISICMNAVRYIYF